MRASVVVNLTSSGSAHRLRDLPAQLAARGIEVAELIGVDGGVALEERVRRFRKNGAKAIIVGGGDGSMMIAANVLAHRDTILGVLPLGTGNSFAQTLGIGTDVDTALDIIASAHVAAVDLGVVNKRYFVNFATVGLSAEIAAKTPHALKPLIGPLAYAVGGIVPFLYAKAFKARIRWDGGKLKLETQQMVIASGRFFGRTPVLPDATIVDGKLAFFTTDGTSHFDIARMYVAFGLGLQTRLPDAHFFSAPKIRIHTNRKVSISVDGDPAGTTPATFRIAKRALRVFVPLSFDDARG